ncbi:MAG: hypothetical protein MZU97_02375 [Bacillus subtilis]|nr:hypothetical protein [Bacillus subtilis]
MIIFENDPNLLNYYIDTDGDGIADFWDNHPTYPDANANGTMDGDETALINFVNVDETRNYNGEAYTTTTIAPPFFIYDGSLIDSTKSNTGLKALVPQRQSAIHTTATGNGALYYINYNSGVYVWNRRVPTWHADTSIADAQKSRFINGNYSGGRFNPEQFNRV